jgi:hypothetical protein
MESASVEIPISNYVLFSLRSFAGMGTGALFVLSKIDTICLVRGCRCNATRVDVLGAVS